MFFLMALTMFAVFASAVEKHYLAFFLCCSLMCYLLVMLRNKESLNHNISLKSIFASKTILTDDIATIILNYTSIVFLILALVYAICGLVIT